MGYQRKIRTLLSTGFLCLALTSCGGGGGSESNAPEESAEDQSEEAQAFLSQIVSLMQTNAVTRNEVDFGNLQAEVDALAADATSIPDTYPAVTRALELIGTNHSFLNAPSGSLITYPSNISCEQPFDIDTPNDPSIGYVRVDAVSTRNGAEGVEIATMIQEAISRRDGPEVTRWIVDLRNNLGGNVFPMIAGLGPLFDQETLGYFIEPDENQIPYGYRNGSSFVDDNNVTTVAEPYTLINPLPRIAVLSSTRTASSGEATYIAFLKQFNVRTFGTSTCGLSTANTPFTLIDGSTLFLTTAVMADRELERYGERVAVDQPAPPQDVLAEAITWLQSQ